MIKRYFLIIEALLKNEQGLTRDELNEMLVSEGEQPFTRKGFQKATTAILVKTGVKITPHDCGKNIWRYRIDRTALEDYDREQLIGNLLANMMQADFLMEFRDLGPKIQPVIIARGTEYLRPIGTALRLNHKLAVTYKKFDEEPYDAILHPYCLKVFAGRWYLFAVKERVISNENISASSSLGGDWRKCSLTECQDAATKGSDNSYRDGGKRSGLQCFSLDRFIAIKVTTESFEPDPSINPQEYFRDAFGIWVDPDGHPAQDIIVACTPKVANYLRSLPLHHTQKEIDMPAPEENATLTCHFTYHISVTPDFIGELNRWGEECVLLKT